MSKERQLEEEPENDEADADETPKSAPKAPKGSGQNDNVSVNALIAIGLPMLIIIAALILLKIYT